MRATMTAEQYRKQVRDAITEDTVQRSIVAWLERLPPPPLGPWWTAVNPVASKTKAVAGRSKWLGLRAGAPDIVLCWWTRFGAVEIKRPSARLGRVSKVQSETHAAILEAGGAIGVARSLSDFIYFLEQAFPEAVAEIKRDRPIISPWWEFPGS
jgi:hypothetical protein